MTIKKELEENNRILNILKSHNDGELNNFSDFIVHQQNDGKFSFMNGLVKDNWDLFTTNKPLAVIAALDYFIKNKEDANKKINDINKALEEKNNQVCDWVKQQLNSKKTELENFKKQILKRAIMNCEKLARTHAEDLKNLEITKIN